MKDALNYKCPNDGNKWQGLSPCRNTSIRRDGVSWTLMPAASAPIGYQTPAKSHSPNTTHRVYATEYTQLRELLRTPLFSCIRILSEGLHSYHELTLFRIVARKLLISTWQTFIQQDTISNQYFWCYLLQTL